jgi:hypothetical protein
LGKNTQPNNNPREPIVYLLLKTQFEKSYKFWRYFFTNRCELISSKYPKISKIIKNKRSIMPKNEWENTIELFLVELKKKCVYVFGVVLKGNNQVGYLK